MTYGIKFTTYAPNTTGEAVISHVLGFDAPLSNGTLIDIFCANIRHKNGLFKTRRAAQAVADKINARGAFGGFGQYATIATVMAS